MNKIKFANGTIFNARDVSESGNDGGRYLRFTTDMTNDITEIIDVLKDRMNRTGIEIYDKDGTTLLMNTGTTYAYGSFNVDRNISSKVCSVSLNSIV